MATTADYDAESLQLIALSLSRLSLAVVTDALVEETGDKMTDLTRESIEALQESIAGHLYSFTPDSPK